MGLVDVMLIIFTNFICTQCKSIDVIQHGVAILECTLSDVTIWQGPPNYTTFTSETTINPSIRNYDRVSVVLDRTHIEYNLKIKNFSKEDEGHYRCVRIPENKPVEYLNYRLQMIVNPTNLRFIGEDNHLIYGFEGRYMNLTCIVDSGSLKETLVLIAKNGTLVHGGPGTITLRFRPRKEHHLMNFTCKALVTATNYCLHHISTLFVNLIPAVEILQRLRLEVIEGDNVNLQCQIISNNPIIQIEWLYYNDTFQTLTPVFYNETFLKITKVKLEDAGIYECMVKNEAGKASDRVVLIVQNKPTISILYDDENSMKTLKCLVHGYTENYTFTDWEHMSEYKEHIRFLKGKLNGHLYLGNDADETEHHHNNGIYVCTALLPKPMGDTTNVSGKYHLFEQGKPYFVTSNNNTYYGLLNQTSFIMVCFVSVPIFTNVMLQDTQRPIVNFVKQSTVLNTVYGNTITENATCIEFNIVLRTVYDFKKYTITVFNKFGNSSFSIELKSKEVLVRIEAEPSNEVRVGDSLRLKCNYGDNKPLHGVIWKYNNLLLFGSGYELDYNSIFFNSVNTHHTGYYSCEIAAAQGNGSGSLLIKIKEKNHVVLSNQPTTITLIVFVLVLLLVIGACLKSDIRTKIRKRLKNTTSSQQPEIEDFSNDRQYTEIESAYYTSIIEDITQVEVSVDILTANTIYPDIMETETVSNVSNTRTYDSVEINHEQISDTSLDQSDSSYLDPCNSYTDLNEIRNRSLSFHRYEKIKQYKETTEFVYTMSPNDPTVAIQQKKSLTL